MTAAKAALTTADSAAAVTRWTLRRATALVNARAEFCGERR